MLVGLWALGLEGLQRISPRSALPDSLSSRVEQLPQRLGYITRLLKLQAANPGHPMILKN